MTSRIDRLRNLHIGATVALLGSSPTISLYEGNEDISLAVNGAVCCPHVGNVDYFVCGDKKSPERRWFEVSYQKAARRIVATFVAPYDRLVCPPSQLTSNFRAVLENDSIHQDEPGGNIRFSPSNLQPAPPHTIFDYADIWEEEIRPEQKRLVRGGTISGVAAQLALIVGAKELHLYGCSFGNTPKGHYGYDNKGEPGGIDPTHPATMDYILARIRSYGVEIFSHGETRLQVPLRITDA